MVKANQDIRDYMADHGVGQRALAEKMGVSQFRVNTMLKTELSQQEKEILLNHIDAIAADKADAENAVACNEAPVEIAEEVEEPQETVETVSTKFQIGDRVKIPSKALSIGVIRDIWSSVVQNKQMYAVETEGGHCGLYAEDQLELAPLPIDYTFEAHIDGNVAVVTMIATQGDKTWIFARGHAHIIHDGEVGMAQAVSYAARRMFECLDKKQDKKIYFKGD